MLVVEVVAVELPRPERELEAAEQGRVRVGHEVGIDQVRDLPRMPVQLDQVRPLDLAQVRAAQPSYTRSSGSSDSRASPGMISGSPGEEAVSMATRYQWHGMLAQVSRAVAVRWPSWANSSIVNATQRFLMLISAWTYSRFGTTAKTLLASRSRRHLESAIGMEQAAL